MTGTGGRFTERARVVPAYDRAPHREAPRPSAGMEILERQAALPRTG
jgi:hypothetical protein